MIYINKKGLLILSQTYKCLVINDVEDIITVFCVVFLIYKYFCTKTFYIDSLYIQKYHTKDCDDIFNFINN